jgi:ATP-dependent Lhr-like helicase
MMNSPRSSSEPISSTNVVDMLAEPIRRWIYRQNWTSLRDVQKRAIPAILTGGDVIVAARTAAGKTEAAMLPLLTRLLNREDRGVDGFGIIYVSPLKALINDQGRRLDELCATCDIPLHRWHGDVSATDKRRARDRPSGLLLITPESLEATLVRRGGEVVSLFAKAEAVVVDELHAFIGTERGVQLQSILSRIESAIGGRHVDRVGLSATLGDMRLAAMSLRPGASAPITIVEGQDPGSGLKLQIRGYHVPHVDRRTARVSGGRDDEEEHDEQTSAPQPVVDDLFRALRGRSNLLFAGSRQNVEIYADALRVESDKHGVPNEFFPHHGSLSKAEREAVETRLREETRPTTAIATTTLELGIDIGDVESVAQVGPGASVASLRQRLGRSGRRAGKPAILRIYVVEREPSRGGHPLGRLRLGLVQSVAMIEALSEGWCEPPVPMGLHLSTLIHQILAVILQTGGLTAASAYRLLCERGAFRTTDKKLFADLLRAMAAPERQLVEQSRDGLLMIGAGGERLTESHEFYTVFTASQDYRILHDGRVLGVYPSTSMIAPGQTLIFGGRRWRIIAVDSMTKVIEVKSHSSGTPPRFDGQFAGVHDKIVAAMRQILLSNEFPIYLDDGAKRLLREARTAALEFELDSRSIVPVGDGCLIIPWVGTKKLVSLALALNLQGADASPLGHAVEMPRTTPDDAYQLLKRLATEAPPSPDALAERVAQPQRAKYDEFLPPDLMRLVTAIEYLDVASIPESARMAIEGVSGR